MSDAAEPLSGWPPEDVLALQAGPAGDDMYGKLYVYVCERLKVFRQRLQSQRFDLIFFNIDAAKLSQRREGKRFDRIEVRVKLH